MFHKVKLCYLELQEKFQVTHLGFACKHIGVQGSLDTLTYHNCAKLILTVISSNIAKRLMILYISSTVCVPTKLLLFLLSKNAKSFTVPIFKVSLL